MRMLLAPLRGGASSSRESRQLWSCSASFRISAGSTGGCDEAGDAPTDLLLLLLLLPDFSFFPPRSGHERNLAGSEPADVAGCSKKFFLAVRGDTPPMSLRPTKKAGPVLSPTAKWAGPVCVGVVLADWLRAPAGCGGDAWGSQEGRESRDRLFVNDLGRLALGAESPRLVTAVDEAVVVGVVVVMVVVVVVVVGAVVVLLLAVIIPDVTGVEDVTDEGGKPLRGLGLGSLPGALVEEG